ncbi:MAG: bifunctional pyr operon transcriptional regulator/uracil phosphoribosyltransferase PyrR [Burkholderiales bacterium]|jgi:pyrimidine operon attenuation protein/uracil phosphoribosyltransferase|nr:bifunctional pyr operon transcriptional regulator/uracil phosphoribosyltransferase PyrR [Burkholderiales bacterium]
MSTAPALPEADALIRRLAEEIAGHLTPQSAVVGIHTGGAWVAQKLLALLGAEIPLGTLDIAFYRDDFSRMGLHPQVRPSSIDFPVEGAHIILVDDVLYTGRTVRAAMNELFDFGRPASIELAVLIDRGGRELPICAQYVGAVLPLPPHQHIQLARDPHGRLSLSLLDKRH